MRTLRKLSLQRSLNGRRKYRSVEIAQGQCAVKGGLLKMGEYFEWHENITIE